MSGPPDWLFDGPVDAPDTVILAHGAGAAMDSAFMQRMARALAERDLRVVRFEFPYMRARRESGRRPPPDRLPVLQQRWLSVIEQAGPAGRLVIGGKSLGGRVASTIADDTGVRGLVCLGYPFHPPGRPERLRVAHLAGLRTPALIVQGTRDALGRPEEIEAYDLSPAIRLHFLEDGDHSFKPRVRSGRTLEQHLHEAARRIREFIDELPPP